MNKLRASSKKSGRPCSIIDLDPVGIDLFRGNSPNTGEQRVFGGLMIGQAMLAACRTVKARLPHSLHRYFIHTGDPRVPLIYKVERLRDGKSYSTRRVTAMQRGSTIVSVMVSFHKGEDGTFEHQDKMPEVPGPEHFAAEELSRQSLYPDLPEIVQRYYEPDRPVELRPVEIGRYVGPKIEDGRVHMWMKAARKLPDDPALHICALAYASDLSLLDAVMARYGRTLFLSGSLDHAIWFHRPFRADDWLLYAKQSVSAQSGRGLARGLIFTRDGTLVASVAQEGSVRKRR
ncbi:acyl-CoA thioesterase II [Bradyrhizobium yuanmingense]|nr:acyl-CoA thioesterase II [Bradyrhizobium yuanmingense]MDF0522270.1 acyl-CoA thioesterase II [Bradyrhizobium yuanmingense]